MSDTTTPNNKENRKTMKTKIRAAIVAAIMAVAIFAITPSANAGTYNVQQCHGSSGYATAGGWTWGANGFANGLAGCTNAFRMFGNASTGPGQYLWWSTPTLPSPLKFTNLSYHLMANDQGGIIHNTTRFCTSGSGAFGVCNGHYASQHIGTLDFTFGQACNINGPFNECNRAVFLFNTGDATYKSVNGHFFMNDMVFTINDPTNPTANAPSGGTMNRSLIGQPRGWNRGTVTINVSGQDGQGGIKSVNGYADGSQILQPTSTSASCSYTAWQPCPLNSNLSAAASVNTSVLSANSGDGAHTYTSRAVDAGDNVSTSSVTFHVDNTNPDAPTAAGVDNATQGWSSTNSFDLSWTNGSEVNENDTQSGIAAVKVDVEPSDVGQTDPAPVTIPIGTTVSGITATVDSVSGVQVPEVGEFAARITVIDRAGNESAAAAGDEGATDANGNPIIGFDPTPPSAPNGQANGWISRDELLAGYDQEWSLTRNAGEFAPICGFAGKISLAQVDDPGSTINIVGDVRKWRLPADLSENNHWVHLRSVTCAGQASSTIEKVEAKVDLTDPTPSYSGVEEGRWYRDGQQVTIKGADALSGMAPSTTVGVDEYLKGAYIDYSINGDSPTDKPRGGSATVTVTGEGQKTLRFSPVDFASNRASETVVRFGIDATNPEGHLARDTERPTLIEAPLVDVTSGLENAFIEIRSQGGGEWKLLPTSLAGGGSAPKSATASARFPDTSLPNGSYAVRVRAFDQAGNPFVTDRDKNGRPLVIQNPMRDAAGLSATLFKSQRTCKKASSRKSRKGRNKHRVVRCTKKQRGKVIFVGGKSNLTVGYKRGAVVQGFLVDDRVKALSRQPIEIYTTSRNGVEQLAGTTSTRSDGSYVFKLKPGVSRNVRVYYPGTELRQDASARVTLGTGAKLSLRVSKKRARTGQTVTFSGTVTSFDRAVPASGKIVALQFYAGKKWRPAVAIARTDKNGRFAVKYKFDGKRVKARIVFRVIAPSEDGWGHATSASRRVVMRVN